MVLLSYICASVCVESQQPLAGSPLACKVCIVLYNTEPGYMRYLKVGCNSMRFKPGTYGDWGPVICFHTYLTQNSGKHDHYDGIDGASYPILRTRSRLDRSIIGARRATDSYIGLINFFAENTAWGDGVEKFLKDEVFALEPKAARSDNYLHGRAPGCCPGVPQVAGMGSEEDYGTGLHCKPA